MTHFRFFRFLVSLIILFTAFAPRAQDVPVVSLQSGHVHSTGDLAFTADGKVMFSVDSNAIIAWDVASRRMLRRLDMPAGFLPTKVAVTPDGKWLAASDHGSDLYLISARDGAARKLETAVTAKHSQGEVAFSPDGRILATAGTSTHVVFWDVATATMLRSHRASALPLTALSWSPDGKQVAVGTDLSVVLVSVADAERRGNRREEKVTALAWGPDGSIAIGTWDGHVRFWKPGDAETTTPWRATTNEHGVVKIAYLPGGRLLTTAFDRAITWSLPQVRELKRFEGRATHAAEVSPDGAEIFISSAPDIHAWAVDTGAERPGFVSRGAFQFGVRFTPDASRILTLGEDHRATVWDIANARALVTDTSEGILEWGSFVADVPRLLRSRRNEKDETATYDEWDAEEKRKLGAFTVPEPHEAAITPDFATLVFFPVRVLGRVNGDVLHAYDVAQRKPLGKLALDVFTGCMAVASSGRQVAACVDKKVVLWNPTTSAVSRTFEGHEVNTSAAAFTEDGRLLVTADEDGGVRVWDVASGAQRATFKAPRRVYNVRPSRDGRWLAISGDFNGALVWSLDSGSAAPRTFGGTNVQDAGFSPDGRLFYTAGGDKSLRLWRFADGFELGRFIPVGKEDWLVITPEGYFNASSYAAAEAVNVNYQGAVYGASDFWDVFYRPDIVRERLAGKELRAGTGGVTFATALAAPPPRDVKVALQDAARAAQATTARARFTVPDAGGGIGEVRVFHNGKLVVSGRAGEGGAKAVCARRGAACEGEVEIEIIPGAENEVSVMAFNGNNTMQGRTSAARFISTLPKREPRLWVVAVGINRFAAQQQAFGTLTNAAKDAQDFLREYEARARGLFKAENIHVVGGPGGGALLDEQATRTAILAALDDVALQARPEDSFVWFVASHGTTTKSGVFGVVPHDIRCADAACAEPANLVEAVDILDRTKSIRAGSQLLVLDTCQSGALDRNIAGFYDARMAALAKQVGLHLYASAQATEYAADSDGVGNGLFTGQLLRGLQSREVDRDADGLVSIVELGAFAQKRTVAATGGVGSRGATVVGAPPARTTRKAAQTPLMMHFGRDRELARVTGN